jgi:very-short-patch-repair endonuclease
MHTSVNVAVAEASGRLRARLDSDPVWRRRDLIAFGVSDALQSAMVRRHVLVRLRHGVYALAEVSAESDPAARHRIDVAAAIAAAEEPTWAFGPSAALLRGLPLPFRAPDRIHLLRKGHADLRSLAQPSRHHLEVPAASIASSSRIGPSDVGAVRGVPCVTRDVAAVTAAVGLTTRWQVAIFDAVLWRESSDAETLLAIAGTWRQLGGLERIRRAIDLARTGAQTPLETISRLALVEERLPEPELQVAFHDAEGLIGYVDMWWPTLGVIGEADGAIKYRSKDDLLAEKVREDRLRALGFIVVRWTWDEIRTNPAAVAERIRRAARRAA